MVDITAMREVGRRLDGWKGSRLALLFSAFLFSKLSLQISLQFFTNKRSYKLISSLGKNFSKGDQYPIIRFIRGTSIYSALSNSEFR